MHRWIRFSARGADLAWRIKNGAKSVPFKTLRTLPDGSELVMLRESDWMRARRRRETKDQRAARLPDTVARLVTFTVTAATRSGRAKTTPMRVLTTLLDQTTYPAREIAALYCRKMANGDRVPPPEEDRQGHPPPAARPVPVTWPARKPGRCCSSTTSRPPLRPRRRIRRHRPRPHPVHRRPRSRPVPRRRRYLLPALRPPSRQRRCPAASLDAAILALPRHRPGRQRTSGRTAAERRTRHTEEVTYTIDITKSNLPQWDTSLKT